MEKDGASKVILYKTLILEGCAEPSSKH